MKISKIVLTGLMIGTFSYLLPMERVFLAIPGAKFVRPDKDAPADTTGATVEFGARLVPSSPLRQAVVKGNLAALKELVAGGEAPHSYRGTNYGETLLHCAAANGHAGIIAYLVTVIGMNPSITDATGATPAHYAASSKLRTPEGLKNKILAISMLKRLGADLTAKDEKDSSILDDARKEEMPATFIQALQELGVS